MRSSFRPACPAATTTPLVCLLALNALRVSDACGAELSDPALANGHRVVRIVGKGAESPDDASGSDSPGRAGRGVPGLDDCFALDYGLVSCRSWGTVVPEHLWVGFLRGMNVGGRRLTNGELVDVVGGCGCADVRAYQASGNVVFNDDRPAEELTTILADGLAQALGYPVPVFLRDAGEVRALATTRAFTEAQLADSHSKPQVIFLHRRPDAQVLDDVVASVPAGDVLIPAGREMHWLPAVGVADSTLDFHRLDELTEGTTVRTLGTVQRIAIKYL